VKYPENIRLAPGQNPPTDPNGVAYYKDCPDGYFAMPEVTFQFHWDRVGQTDPWKNSTEGWRLDSDRGAAGMSLHGDWMNAWEPSMMQSIVDNCIKDSLLCINQISANRLLVR